MNKVTCIIPAYNESKRIGNVLEALSGHPMISEILVVDDCSSDNTKDVAEKFPGVRVIRNNLNLGKSKTIREGILKAEGEIIVMIDADLQGLTKENVSALLEPIFNGSADCTMSLRRVSVPLDLMYRIIGFDMFSGERAFRKDFVLPHLDEIAKLTNFGLETFLNGLMIKEKSRLKVVYWPNVRTPLKSEKEGALAGVKSDVKMARDILKTASPFKLLGQIFRLQRLQK